MAFSTLAGRPSRYEFEKSKELQDWVTATELRVTLDRMNTFGDEVFESPQVLKSYYYAISDLAIGGRLVSKSVDLSRYPWFLFK